MEIRGVPKRKELPKEAQLQKNELNISKCLKNTPLHLASNSKKQIHLSKEQSKKLHSQAPLTYRQKRSFEKVSLQSSKVKRATPSKKKPSSTKIKLGKAREHTGFGIAETSKMVSQAKLSEKITVKGSRFKRKAKIFRGKLKAKVITKDVKAALKSLPTKRQDETSALMSRALSEITNMKSNLPSSKLPKPDTYGITTWELKIDGQSFRIKEFAAGSYNWVKTEQYFDRADLMFETALSKDIPTSSKAYISGLQADCLKELKEQCTLDPAIISLGGAPAEEHFNEKHELAIKILAKNFRKVEDQLRKDLYEDVSLAYLEKVHVRNRGRPIIMNLFTMPGTDKQMVDFQIPLSDRTIPSSLRETEGLSNFVETGFGVVQKDGSIKATMTSTRHSSFAPIAVKDPLKRQAAASRNVRQELSTCVEKTIPETLWAQSSEKNPIPLTVRDMMLFTPVKMDTLRDKQFLVAGKWKGESEQAQMKEAIQSLNMYHDRPVMLTIHGQAVWVKPNVSMMNMGCNPEAVGMGAFGKLPLNKLQNEMNASGYCQFENDTETFIYERLTFLKSNPNIPKKEFEHLENRLNKLQSLRNKELGALKSNYLHTKSTEEEIIAKQSKLLEKNLESYSRALATQNEKEIKSLKVKIKKNQKKMELAQHKINKAALELVEGKKKAYKANKKEITKLNKAIAKDFNTLLQSLPKAEKEKLSLIRDVHLNRERFISGFHRAVHKKADTVMDLQSNYIHTHSLMQTWGLFHCKSGEDRTGNVDIKIKSAEIFRQIYARMPSTKKDFALIKKEILPLLHQYSASIDNTRENSNATGLQVRAAVNPGSYADKIDFSWKMARLAKGVPSAA